MYSNRLWCLMPLSTIFQWRSVLLVEETRVSGENNWPVASQWQTLSHNVLSSTPCHAWGSTLVAIGSLCSWIYKIQLPYDHDSPFIESKDYMYSNENIITMQTKFIMSLFRYCIFQVKCSHLQILIF